MSPQLLDLFTTTATFDSFIPINNEIVTSSLHGFSNQFTHIVGGNLSGKTHLLQAWIRLAKSQNKTAIYIESKQDDSVNLRDIVQKFRFIAIDNVEKLNGLQQVLLFDLFNSIKQDGLDNFLLTSSHGSLESLTTLRDDLKTRLLSGLNLHLKALGDEDLLHALTMYIKKEGVKIPPPELNYLIRHYARNIGALIAIIHKIAEAALLENRIITIPLIKQVITT